MATERQESDMALSEEKAAGTTTGHGHATRFIFLALGLAISAWAVLVPYAKARLGVNEAELGLLLLLVGTGAIISMPFAGWLTGKYGCRKTLVVSTTVFMLSLTGLACVSSSWAFGLSLFLFGASSGVVDVGMNIQAILVEKERNRSMMSGLHGMYSVGGFFGALIISALLNLGLSPLSAILCLTVSLIAGLLVMARYLFPYGHESKNRKSFSLPKGSILMLIIVAVRLDILLNTNYVRDAVCIGFCVNELLSIVENTSLMGIPYPPAIKKAIEVLQKRAQHIDDDIQKMIDDMEDDKK